MTLSAVCSLVQPGAVLKPAQKRPVKPAAGRKGRWLWYRLGTVIANVLPPAVVKVIICGLLFLILYLPKHVPNTTTLSYLGHAVYGKPSPLIKPIPYDVNKV
jgi:hypothetical protein